ncbi:MAG: hypothetical protein WAU49_18515 [Steroidobacteraceae bacterium]
MNARSHKQTSQRPDGTNATQPVGPAPVVFNQRMLRYYDRRLEFTCNLALYAAEEA